MPLTHRASNSSSRRAFLARAGGGMGALALASLLDGNSPSLAAGPALDGPRKPHFEPRVKRVIWLFMHGGPSHVDLFDPKPELKRLAGMPLPDSFGRVMTRRKVAENPLLPPLKPLTPRG